MNLSKVLSYHQLAKSIAQENLTPNTHISLMFSGKRLISVGTNWGKSHTEALRRNYYSPIPHSELSALIKIPYHQRSNLILINYRFNRRFELRKSDPCYRCSAWVNAICSEIWASQTDQTMLQLK